MNPYASSSRWRLVAPSRYQSPCSRWTARRAGYSSWRLADRGGVERGPYLSLAECQAVVEGFEGHERTLSSISPRL